MVTLDRIRYFIEAAQLEHVGKAAKSLNTSPSVISSAILVLEEEFKTKFFIRENNRLKLNEDGEVFLEKARALIEASHHLYTHSQDNIGKKRHYRLGGSHFLLNQYLIPAFIKLQKEFPLLTAEFVALDTGAAISDILHGELDAALVFRSSLNYDLEETVLKKEQFFIAVKKGHVILDVTAKQKVLELNKLPAITFKTSEGPSFPENHPIFKTFGIIPKHTYFYADDQSALQLLLKTDGWALLPKSIIDENKSKIEILKMSKEWDAPVSISFLRNNHKTGLVFTERLKESLLR